MEVSGGNNVCNLTKHDKIQITGATLIKSVNSGKDYLQNWVVKCADKNNDGKISCFIRSTKTSSPTSSSGSTISPPIDNSFMSIETSSGNSGSDNVFCSFERTDFIQITNITFNYNRFSFLTNDSLKLTGRFRTLFLLADNT